MTTFRIFRLGTPIVLGILLVAGLFCVSPVRAYDRYSIDGDATDRVHKIEGEVRTDTPALDRLELTLGPKTEVAES